MQNLLCYNCKLELNIGNNYNFDYLFNCLKCKNDNKYYYVVGYDNFNIIKYLMIPFDDKNVAIYYNFISTKINNLIFRSSEKIYNTEIIIDNLSLDDFNDELIDSWITKIKLINILD